MSIASATVANTTEPVSLGLAPLLRLVARQWRRNTLSQDERRLLHLVQFATERVGDPLLAAKDADDLEDRLDALCEDPDAFATLSLFAREAARLLPAARSHGSNGDVNGLPALRGVSPALLKEGDRIALALGEVTRQAVAQMGTAPAMEQVALPVPITDLASVYPATIAHGMLEGVKSTFCLLGYSRAVLEPSAGHEEWAPRALAQRWVAGTRELLGLVAAAAGVDLPEDLLPAECRPDIEGLVRRRDEVEAAFSEMSKRARESGKTVFLEAAEPDDD